MRPSLLILAAAHLQHCNALAVPSPPALPPRPDAPQPSPPPTPCAPATCTQLDTLFDEFDADRSGTIDEFELAGLTPAASRVISAPRVAEAPVSFECRVSQVLRLTGADGGQTDTWMVFGEVVGVYIAKHLLVDGIYDTAAAHPILRAGGPADYFDISADQRFQMHRPG